MKNSINYPLLIELNSELNYRQSDKLNMLDESLDDSGLVFQLTDSKGLTVFEIPYNKVLTVCKNETKFILALNHICFEYSNKSNQLIFHRIDRDDLDAIDPIFLSTRHIKKVFVDGKQIWPQILKHEAKLHTSKQIHIS